MTSKTALAMVCTSVWLGVAAERVGSDRRSGPQPRRCSRVRRGQSPHLQRQPPSARGADKRGCSTCTPNYTSMPIIGSCQEPAKAL